MYIFSAKKFVPVKTGHSTSRTQRVVPNIRDFTFGFSREGGGSRSPANFLQFIYYKCSEVVNCQFLP